MATAIRPIPTLQGKDAERFLKMAEASEQNTNRKDISKNIALVQDFLKKQQL